MPGKTTRSSNLELLRILCMLLIIGDHITGQGGIADYSTLPSSFAFCLIGCGSRIACSVFILIGGWFLCEQPYKTRRPLSLWLSLWLYTVPVTLLCKLTGMDVSFGALRWAAFPASTRQLWFISDYLLLLLCVPPGAPGIAGCAGRAAAHLPDGVRRGRRRQRHRMDVFV